MFISCAPHNSWPFKLVQLILVDNDVLGPDAVYHAIKQNQSGFSF